jgi:hypothetical protein
LIRLAVYLFSVCERTSPTIRRITSFESFSITRLAIASITSGEKFSGIGAADCLKRRLENFVCRIAFNCAASLAIRIGNETVSEETSSAAFSESPANQNRRSLKAARPLRVQRVDVSSRSAFDVSGVFAQSSFSSSAVKFSSQAVAQ